MGCEARKIPAAGEIFFLTSTFIELLRRVLGLFAELPYISEAIIAVARNPKPAAQQLVAPK